MSEAIEMENTLCPLCGTGNGTTSNISDTNGHDPFLQTIIYKHLHIKIVDNNVDNVCLFCKQTVFCWDEFANKCWETQNLLGGKYDEHIKSEHGCVEVKIEKNADHFDNDHFANDDDDDDDDKDDNIPIMFFNFKNEDPLESIKSDVFDRKTAKKISKKLSKKSSSKKLKLKPSEMDDEDKDDIISIAKIKKEKNNIPVKSSFVDCHICSTKTKSWVYLLRHFSKDHPTEKAKALCECGKYLSSKRSILTHNTLHDDTKALKCEECNKKFGNKHVFREHMLIHFPDKGFRYSCPYCEKKFFQRSVLKTHINIHLPSDLKYTFTCDICGDKFGSNFILQTHKLSKHDNIRNHICDNCGLTFVTKNHLEGHKKTVHNEIRNFECDKCPKKFKLRKHLKRHRDDVHFPKELKCPLCPAVLKNMTTFQKHKNAHNNPNRPKTTTSRNNPYDTVICPGEN